MNGNMAIAVKRKQRCRVQFPAFPRVGNMSYEYKRLKRGGKCIDEHRLIMGVKDRSLDVHHINGNKRDNRPSNLEIMTRADHMKIHGIQPPHEYFDFDENDSAYCRRCGEYKTREQFKLNKSYTCGRQSICKICVNKKKREDYVIAFPKGG